MNGVIKEEEQQQEQIGVGGAPAVDGANGGGGGGGAQLEPEQFRKLFIGGLSLNTTDETLHSFYSQFGELVDCIVMRDSSTKRSRGFGFVSFSSQAEVDRAMEARPHTIDGKVVDPKRAVPRDQSQKSEQNMSTKRLYVSGVREEHTDDDFERHFSEYGKVTKVEIISDKNTQKTRGFAFITFDDYDPVDRCVLLKSHMIKGFRCDVKKALSREEMQKAQQKERDRAERGVRSRGNGRRDGGGGGGGYGRGGGGGYGGHHGGGYGGYGGGYGGPPQWGPPAGPPQWGGYGGGYGQYGQTAPAPWSAPTGGPAGPQATEQGQWGGGYGAQGGGWGGGGGSGGQWPAGGGAANATGTGGDYSGTWGNAPQGVPPPQQWSGAQRF